MSTPASRDLRQLASDLRAAGQNIGHAATEIVHVEASQIEADVRAIDGQPTSVVVTYPGAQQAQLSGTEQYGVAQESSPFEALESVNIRDVAASMASDLADAGAELITRGSR